MRRERVHQGKLEAWCPDRLDWTPALDLAARRADAVAVLADTLLGLLLATQPAAASGGAPPRVEARHAA